MGESIGRGMTLVLSLWDDKDDHMLWLDGTEGGDPDKPGVVRGPCSATSGNPSDVRQKQANAYAEYYNFRYGELDSTLNAPSPTPPVPPSPQPSPPVPPTPVPPTPVPSPTPQPPTPTPPSGASCCYGGCGASAWNCQSPESWCSESQQHCEGNCGGKWCTSAIGLVQRHGHLRGDADDMAVLQSFSQRVDSEL